VSTSNVSPLKSPVNSTLEDVRNWAGVMAKRGVIAENSVRLRQTAVNQLETILEEDEPREAQWFLSNLKTITQRWTIKNSANPDTAQTYESRARRLLSDYLQYIENPTGFTPRVAKARTRKPKEQDAAKPEVDDSDDDAEDTVIASATGQSTIVTPPPTASGQPAMPKFHEVQLGKDKEPFRYVIPDAGLTMADVNRIAIALAANAHDFDPAFSQVTVKNRLPNGAE